MQVLGGCSSRSGCWCIVGRHGIEGGEGMLQMACRIVTLCMVSRATGGCCCCHAAVSPPLLGQGLGTVAGAGGLFLSGLLQAGGQQAGQVGTRRG